MEIAKDLRFEAAHYLPLAGAGHKCARLHGHSFKVEIRLTGEIDESRGWVLDFGEVRAACEPLVEALDHRLLNEIPGLENPTSELLARWIWERLRKQLPSLSAVVVHETCTSRVTYCG